MPTLSPESRAAHEELICVICEKQKAKEAQIDTEVRRCAAPREEALSSVQREQRDLATVQQCANEGRQRAKEEEANQQMLAEALEVALELEQKCAEKEADDLRERSSLSLERVRGKIMVTNLEQLARGAHLERNRCLWPAPNQPRHWHQHCQRKQTVAHSQTMLDCCAHQMQRPQIGGAQCRRAGSPALIH
jgi:hypothetical protein